MANKVLKIVFQTKRENGAVNWENFYDEVDAILTSNRKPSLKVFMRNPMPKSEMNAIVRELCSFISTKFKCKVNPPSYGDYAFSAYDNVLRSATYHIEIRPINIEAWLNRDDN